MVISENNHCVHKPDPRVKKVALGCQRWPTFHRSCFIGHCTLSAPFTTYLLSLNVNATRPLVVLDTYNKGHSVVLCSSHCCVIWPAAGSPPPPTPTSRLGSCQPPCPGGEGNQIWLQQRNPVVYWNKSSHGACCKGRQVWHLVEQRRLDSAGDTILVTLYWCLGDNILVTLYASHNMLVKLYWWHYSVVTLISHQAPFTLSGDTVQYFWFQF